MTLNLSIKSYSNDVANNKVVTVRSVPTENVLQNSKENSNEQIKEICFCFA